MHDAEEGRIDPIAGSEHTSLVVTATERLVLPDTVLEAYGVARGDQIRFSRNQDGSFNVEKVNTGDAVQAARRD